MITKSSKDTYKVSKDSLESHFFERPDSGRQLAIHGWKTFFVAVVLLCMCAWEKDIRIQTYLQNNGRKIMDFTTCVFSSLPLTPEFLGLPMFFIFCYNGILMARQRQYVCRFPDKNLEHLNLSFQSNKKHNR